MKRTKKVKGETKKVEGLQGRWRIESFWRLDSQDGRVPVIEFTIDSEEALWEHTWALEDDENPALFRWTPELWLWSTYRYDRETGLHMIEGRPVTPEGLPGLIRRYPERVRSGEQVHIIRGLHRYLAKLATDNAHRMGGPEA